MLFAHFDYATAVGLSQRHVHTAEAVLGVKPWEYGKISTKTERLVHTLCTVALSQSVCGANNAVNLMSRKSFK